MSPVLTTPDLNHTAVTMDAMVAMIHELTRSMPAIQTVLAGALLPPSPTATQPLQPLPTRIFAPFTNNSANNITLRTNCSSSAPAMVDHPLYLLSMPPAHRFHHMCSVPQYRHNIR
jgi:hypothetical protein